MIGGRLGAAAVDRRRLGPAARVGEAFWLLGLFAASIGLPFFALAANSPLLQAWFARTDHPAAKDPISSMPRSNVGSFLALVSYPLVVEPFVRLGDQTWFWTIGFYLLIALIAGCGMLLWRSPGQELAARCEATARRTRRRPGGTRRSGWPRRRCRRACWSR